MEVQRLVIQNLALQALHHNALVSILQVPHLVVQNLVHHRNLVSMLQVP
eukprot:CAMPEP_0172761108 /NCGR_PEP_ID=MMETSP1074-20121228/170982_1 /TAXON_ID=2916 /ORGANISM="Ceratium fusus, Strain PA161109" /LENGTH=48 /DNA_ID= /DNA_START= /DNA_END= /DNA_ORIENTATION=